MQQLCRTALQGHCVSQWGHDFRPAYKKLSLLRKKFRSVPITVLTATATEAVRVDVCKILGITNGVPPFRKLKVFQTSFNRTNLRYSVLQKPKEPEDSLQVASFSRLYPESLHKHMQLTPVIVVANQAVTDPAVLNTFATAYENFQFSIQFAYMYPADAPKDSLRGGILGNWQALGLASAPNTGNNCVHASASPFEGFAERTNWLKDAYSFASDPFGKLLLDAGIPEATLKEWSVDPQVVLPGSDKKGSLFDAVEDMDVEECVKKLVAIYAAQPKSVS